MSAARTVLIVEDNPGNLEIATLFLEGAGYRVIQASAAQEGLRLAREAAPALILMDLSLPGMDGLEAVRILREQEATAGIPVLAFTAHAMKEDVEKALQAGCSGCITKPFGGEDLLATVARWGGPADGEKGR